VTTDGTPAPACTFRPAAIHRNPRKPQPAPISSRASRHAVAHLLLFSDDAVRAIHTHARGLPRAINRLAITALLAACAAGKTIADESAARAAIAEEAAAATD
jgi:hypothetical protein